MATAPPITYRRRGKSSSDQPDTLVALSPQQVSAYPAIEQNLTMSGNRMLESSAASDSKAVEKENFLQISRDRFRVCYDAEAKRRSEMQTDNQFRCGQQWDTGIQIQRDAQRRPCLTINRIPGFVKHVVNNLRQERPSIKVDPVGDGSDEDVAEVRQGLMRHIEVRSRAEVAYDIAFENMCVMGLGWMRVVDDWSDPTSFDKDLFIRAIPDTFSVYSDPFVQQPDWSDMKFAFVVEDLTRKEFIDQYGEKFEATSRADFSSMGDMAPMWFPGGKIRVAEYFWITQEKDILCELDNGSTQVWSELKKLKVDGLTGEEQMYSLEVDDDGDRVVVHEDYRGRTRDCIIPRCNWAKISAVDILRQRKWSGRFIPLIPIIGNQIEFQGDRLLVGMVRYAREPQRMYNYMYSSFVETCALAPKSPFVAEVDQVPDGMMPEWQAANTMPVSVLRYKRVIAEAGNSAALVPPPQRQQAEPPIAAFVEGLRMADANLKAVFSIYEASLGQRGPQESGRAINARKVESETATYDWGDNFIRGLCYLGTVLDDLLQYYYNSPGRVVQIDREDNTKRKIVLNQEFTEKGELKKYDLSKGKNAIVVSTGPSFNTRREQAAASMLEYAKVNPLVMQVAGDIIADAMDWPEHAAVADRLKKALPPGVAGDDQEDSPIPPQVKNTLDQAMQQIQQLTEALHQATDANNLETMKQQWETLRTQMVEENKQAMALLKTGSQEAQFMSDKLFKELEWIRSTLAPETVGKPAAAAPPPSSAAVPAGPPTGGGAVPSVGGQ